jgi:hypothetical protein
MGPVERFFASFLNRFTIKGKLRLGFFLIPLFTLALGYTGYVGMVRVRYATQYQAYLTRLSSLTFEVVYREGTLFSHYQSQVLDEVNRTIKNLLAQKPQKESKGFIDRIFSITAFVPRDLRSRDEGLWQYIKDLVIKTATINQYLQERWKRGGAVDQV